MYILNYMYKVFHNNLPNIIQVKYINKYIEYSFIIDTLFYIKPSKLDTKIKCVSVSGCILLNELDLIINNSITYYIYIYSIRMYPL